MDRHFLVEAGDEFGASPLLAAYLQDFVAGFRAGVTAVDYQRRIYGGADGRDEAGLDFGVIAGDCGGAGNWICAGAAADQADSPGAAGRKCDTATSGPGTSAGPDDCYADPGAIHAGGGDCLLDDGETAGAFYFAVYFAWRDCDWDALRGDGVDGAPCGGVRFVRRAQRKVSGTDVELEWRPVKGLAENGVRV